MRETRLMSTRQPLLLAVSLVCCVCAVGQSRANTAANAGIPDTAAVVYSSSGNTVQAPVRSPVTATVNLVPFSPVLNSPPNQSIVSGAAAVYAYTITTTANGPETFNLTTSDTPAAGLSNTAVSLSLSSVTLGATTFYSLPSGTAISGALNAQTMINVPSDMNAGDATVNGLGAGDMVVIDGVSFVVDSVVAKNNGSAQALDQLVLRGTGTANVTPAMGDLIAQRVSFTLTVGATNNSNGALTEAVNLTAIDPVHAAATASHGTVTTVTSVGVVVTKYVRNITAVVKGSGTPLTVAAIRDGVYYAGGVAGNPGDTLEYLIHVVRSAATSATTSVIINDPLADAVAYVPNSLRYDGCAGSGFNSLSDASDKDVGTVVNNTVYLNQGAISGKGTLVSGTGAAAALTCNLVYQVKLK